MKISGRQLLAVEESAIRSSLVDPYALRTIIPGCETVEPVGPDEYRVWINLRVGMTTDRYTGLLKLKTPAGGRNLEFLADGESPNGLIYCRGWITLETEGERQTAVCYEAEIDVGGRIATLSPRLLETTARSFARRCLEGLDKQVPGKPAFTPPRFRLSRGPRCQPASPNVSPTCAGHSRWSFCP
jgi:carbon monoxide dehydrogenase subunit G